MGPHLGIQRGPGVSRGTPGTENDTQIDEKTIKNVSIPLCFFNILGATLGDTVPQKGEHSVLVLTHFSCKNRGHSPTLEKTLRHAQFLSHDILAQSQCPVAAAEGAKLSKICMFICIPVRKQ